MAQIFTAYGNGTLAFNQHRVHCALGKGGLKAASDKRERDGASPVGIWPIRYVFYRPDRLEPPKTALKCLALSPDDGWCDDPTSPFYNQHIKLPFEASHEKLWRDDHVYDVIVVLGHNDDPPVSGMGSAIFMHLARADYSPTEGCVALALPDLLAILQLAEPGDGVEIVD